MIKDQLEAEFVKSSAKVSQCPKPVKPEYAFIGRSNVGKSSLINKLVNNSKLAKISGRPGKTTLINHFLVEKTWYLVDLPGYGYAKVSKTSREKWILETKKYLLDRKNLICTFLLVDGRIPQQKIDAEFMQWMGKKGIPFAIVFTKLDKLSSREWGKNRAAYHKKMAEQWQSLPPQFYTSAENGMGRTEMLQFIEQYNTAFKPKETYLF